MPRKKGAPTMAARAYQADIEWVTNAGRWNIATALASVIEHARLTGYRPDLLCYLPYNERMNDARGRALLGQAEQLEAASAAAAEAARRLRAERVDEDTQALEII